MKVPESSWLWLSHLFLYHYPHQNKADYKEDQKVSGGVVKANFLDYSLLYSHYSKIALGVNN